VRRGLDAAAWCHAVGKSPPRISVTVLDEQIFVSIEEAEAFDRILREAIRDARKGLTSGEAARA